MLALPAEAHIRVLRAASRLDRAFAELVKPHGLTPVQYNVLRILRGAGPEGATCGEIAARLISHDPDITRLLDRLEARGWTGRARGGEDRRVVRTRLTRAGLALVNRLDAPVGEFHRRTLGPLGETRLRTLTRILQRVESIN